MGLLHEFLLEGTVEESISTQVKIQGFPHPFEVKSISEGENKDLRKSCKRMSMDRKTHQKSSELDMDLYGNRLVVACCVDPNFKDAELQKRFGIVGAEALIDRILKPGQYQELLLAVQEVNGFTDSMDELRDEAKN